MRHELETTMNIKACDIYGLSEVMGPGVAGEAVETQDGSHIWEDHFRPEIIDAFDPTVVLGDGEPGELVFTSLTKEALPIIRYRTKDLTRLLPGTARPAHRRMGRITGRSDDMIILRGVNLFPSQIEEIALRIPELSPHFQLELTRPEGQRMDQLTVKIERRDAVTSRAPRPPPRPCSSRSRSTSAPPARSTSSSPAPWSGPTASCAGSTTCAPRPDHPSSPPAARRHPRLTDLRS